MEKLTKFYQLNVNNWINQWTY